MYLSDSDPELKQYKDELLRTYLKLRYPRLTASELMLEALFEAANEGYTMTPQGIKFSNKFLDTYLSAIEKFELTNQEVLPTLFAYLLKNYPKNLNSDQITYILKHPSYFNESTGADEIYKLNAYVALCNTNNHTRYGMTDAPGYEEFYKLVDKGKIFNIEVSPDRAEFNIPNGEPLGLMPAKELRNWLNEFHSNSDTIDAVDYLRYLDPPVKDIKQFRERFKLQLSNLDSKLLPKVDALLKKIEENRTFQSVFTKFEVSEDGSLDNFFKTFIKFITNSLVSNDKTDEESTEDTTTTTKPSKKNQTTEQPREQTGKNGYDILKAKYNRLDLYERDLKKHLTAVAKQNNYDLKIVDGIFNDVRKFNELRRLLSRPVKIDDNVKDSGLRQLNELLRKFLFKYRP